MNRKGSLSLRARSGLAAIVAAFVVTIIWFFTPAPTLAAQYVWNEWRAGALALVLDRADANLAFSIGVYYFGDQSTIGTADTRPYELPIAERAFEKAILIDPSLPLARYMRARIEFIHSDFNAALADLNAEFALDPVNKRTLYMRALTYAYRNLPGDLSRAEEDFRSVIAWAPHKWAGYNDLAYVLAKEKKYADAVPVLREGIKKADGGDKNPWLWNTLGVMELNMQNPSEALSSFLKAQVYAATLVSTDWERAYPGNDPALAPAGLEALRSGIARNVIAARAALTK